MPYLNIYVRSYLISTECFNVFIDSGLRGNLSKIQPYLENGKQNVLLMTHGHWDHIGLNAEIKRFGGTIYAHPDDTRFFEDFDWHWEVGFGQYEKDFNVPKERGEVYWREIGSPTAIDCFLK